MPSSRPVPDVPILPRAFPRVEGRCPACGLAALFLGEGGYITCGNLPCPDPCAASDLLAKS